MSVWDIVGLFWRTQWVGEAGWGDRLPKAKGDWGPGTLLGSAGRSTHQRTVLLKLTLFSDPPNKKGPVALITHPITPDPHFAGSAGFLLTYVEAPPQFACKSHLFTLCLEQADWDRPCLYIFPVVLNLTSSLTITTSSRHFLQRLSVLRQHVLSTD